MKELDTLADVFAAMQGDPLARARVESSKKRVRLYYNTIIVTDENGKEAHFPVM